MSGPLEGFRIIDLSTVVMGPYATQVLCDHGATVIKVESPGGDIMRAPGPAVHPGMGHLFLTTNRGKRSIVLDLKHPRGRQALLDLSRSVDAIVYNIRPQAMARLQLAYEDLAAINPGIIYAGAFGFSQRGPYADRPAYDDLIQGMSGLPWLSLQAGAETPRYAPVILADRMVGLMVANSLLSALLCRQRTGRGQRIDIPMFETLASIILGEHMAGRLFDPPQGPVGYPRSMTPERRPYKTRDGYLCTMVYTDRHWRAFLDAIGQGGKFDGDERFSSHTSRNTHISEVYRFLAEVLLSRTTGEWMDVFSRNDIPAAPMYSIDDIMDDAHLRAIGFFSRHEHPSEGTLISTAVPTEWSETMPAPGLSAPRLGQHTREILKEAGYAPERIAELLRSGAAAQAPD